MVAKLITTSSTGEKTEFELVNETTTIGRKPGNDIQIDNLSVSGRHAQVITILEDSFLEDLGSTNGTYVNGKLVKKHALKMATILPWASIKSSTRTAPVAVNKISNKP